MPEIYYVVLCLFYVYQCYSQLVVKSQHVGKNQIKKLEKKNLNSEDEKDEAFRKHKKLKP